MSKVAIIPSTVGFHWEEVFEAYRVFKNAGWQISFYTVDGKPPTVDPNSVKHRPVLSFLGLGVRDSFSPESLLGKELMAKLQSQSLAIEQLNVDNIDAIYIPGGHGCLFDVNVNPIVHNKLREAFSKQKILGAVCHGSSCLAFVQTQGVSIIKGKKIIGFLDASDKLLMTLGLIEPSFLPLPYWNEQAIIKAGGIITQADRVKAMANPAYTVVDLPFITGVGPKAAGKVAGLIIENVYAYA